MNDADVLAQDPGKGADTSRGLYFSGAGCKFWKEHPTAGICRGILFVLFVNVWAVLRGGSRAGWLGCARSHRIWVPRAGEQEVKR